MDEAHVVPQRVSDCGGGLWMRLMLSHNGCLQATVRGRGGEDLHHWSGMRLSDSLTALIWGCLCWAVAGKSPSGYTFVVGCLRMYTGVVSL